MPPGNFAGMSEHKPCRSARLIEPAGPNECHETFEFVRRERNRIRQARMDDRQSRIVDALLLRTIDWVCDMKVRNRLFSFLWPLVRAYGIR